MSPRSIALLALLASGAVFGQTSPSLAPETVEISSGALHLKAYLWKPSGPGPFPAVLFNHGRSDTPQQHTRTLTITSAAQILGPVFAKHGYVFLYLFRRGEGLSGDQGSFIGDLRQREESARGVEARDHLNFTLMTTVHLKDGTAGLSYLKSLTQVDIHRIAIVGHSFGGGITLLEAAHDPAVRALVTFGAGAGSWSRSPELRALMLTTMHEIRAPVLLIHAAHDYSVAPGQAMAGELDQLSKPHVLTIYPPVGDTPSDGHNFLYTDVALWEDDVFRFLDEHVKR